MSSQEKVSGSYGNYVNEAGKEVLSRVPVAPPVGYKPSPSMIDHVRAMVRQEMSRAAAEQGYETFEEANDFEVGDDYEPNSPYEEQEMEPATVLPAADAGGASDGLPPDPVPVVAEKPLEPAEVKKSG